jgi:GNAT superfamily N-acetyltransferase
LKLKGADAPGWRIARWVFAALVVWALWYSQRRLPWWQWLTQKEYLGPFEFALGAAAVVLAGLHAFHLEKITKSVSTRFIGRFPDDLDAIRSLVDNSVQRIKILVDAVDYGSFFRPLAHERLFRALRAARERGVDVHILVCGSPQPLSHASYSADRVLLDLKGNIEFETTLSIYLDGLRGDEPFRSALPGFLADLLKVPAYEGLLRGKNPTQDGLTDFIDRKKTNGRIDWCKNAEFMALLLCRHEWFAQRLRSDGVKIEIDWEAGQLQQFVWLRDGIEAVFLFPSADRDKQKLAFLTRDPQLVTTFEHIFTQRCEKFKPPPAATPKLRPATTGDETFVNELLVTTMRKYVEATWPDDTCAQQQYYEVNRCDPSHTQIIQLEDKDIGRLSKTVKGDCIFIDEMHIRPEYQGRGIGTKLIEQELKLAREKGLPVKLTVLTVNLPAACLYRRMGFTVTEEKEHRLHMQSAR